MLRVVTPRHARLEKSSKGTVLRAQAEVQFAKQIEEAYKEMDGSKEPLNVKSETATVSDEQLADAVAGIVLTGATGSLGAHILHLLRSEKSVSRIYCLVRAKDDFAAYDRVNRSLLQRGKAPLDQSSNRVRPVLARLGDEHLGLPLELYQLIAHETTLIIHAAWAVNFSMRLQSFATDHIGGLHNLIQLALTPSRESPAQFFFCSSTATVLGPHSPCRIPESVSHDAAAASGLGYSRSKWVAENICERAHETTKLHGRIGILRIGQLCGDTKRGIWNMSEAWPLMLSSVQVTGALPRLDEPLSWLPVDIAAQAILQIALPPDHPSPLLANDNHDNHDNSSYDVTNATIPVYHLVNNDQSRTWSGDLLPWMTRLEGPSAPFQIVSATEWLSLLEHLPAPTGDQAALQHPARKLLALWKTAYAAIDPEDGPDCQPRPSRPTKTPQPQRRQTTAVVFDTHRTERRAPIIRHGGRPMTEEQFARFWAWLKREMLLDPGADGER
ncbi:MAG: hypothetical protein M1826_003001 [Phylliscum demangeonii]|nr:MAG: hypothetical protein M1826_003001 [Phylliscum demangeonii]